MMSVHFSCPVRVGSILSRFLYRDRLFPFKAQWLDSARALRTAQVQSSAASQLYADAAELGAREAALFSGVTNQ